MTIQISNSKYSTAYSTLYNETDGRHFLKIYVPNHTELVFKKGRLRFSRPNKYVWL
jgi:hypothetical protein